MVILSNHIECRLPNASIVCLWGCTKAWHETLEAAMCETNVLGRQADGVIGLACGNSMSPCKVKPATVDLELDQLSIHFF